jgi:cytidyltransferase-like protein
MTTAFFPGKFQPPHLGHFLTLMKLYPKYDRIIVGITEDEPRVISPEKTKIIFTDMLRYLQKFRIILIKGTLIKKETLEGLPSFDVLVSGNKNVIDWAKKMDVATEFTQRSSGVGFSGTELRELYKKK